jgi:hypothetical protein
MHTPTGPQTHCWKTWLDESFLQLGFTEDNLETFRPKVWKMLNFIVFFVIGNSIKLQKNDFGSEIIS